MDSRLDETESLVTSVECSEDDLPLRKAVVVHVGLLGNTHSSSDIKANQPPLLRKNYKKDFKDTLDSTGEMRQLWIEHTKSLKRTASKFS